MQRINARPTGVASVVLDDSAVLTQVMSVLKINRKSARRLMGEAERLYEARMRARFMDLKVSDRLKRTNPFLLRIRGVSTVAGWAEMQIGGALIASEEEAVGHLLEAIATICFPDARVPQTTEDLDFEVDGPAGQVDGYQVKMSWDCMPMSSRKNLSATVRRRTSEYRTQGRAFVGYFAPCYGKATTTCPSGQNYVSLRSREFWTRVGSGDEDFDVKVGEVCALLCTRARTEIAETLIPELNGRLVVAAESQIGDGHGLIDFTRLFRRINK